MTIRLPGNEALTDFEEIGRGGCATVFRALDPGHDRYVAVKVLLDDDGPTDRQWRFERERTALGALSDHPNIVTLFDSGRCLDGRPFLVMEYLPGGSLADRVADGSVSWQDASVLAIHLCGALGAAHDAGVVHGDITPANVLCSEYGDWKLADFGVAELASDASVGAKGAAVRWGSLAHGAPEAFTTRSATALHDLYGLTSTIHTAMTATEPFAPRGGEEVAATVRRIAQEPLPDPRQFGVPDVMARLFEVGLGKDPAARPQSAALLAEGFNAARQQLGAASTSPPLRLGNPSATEAGRRHSAGAAGQTSEVPFLPPEDILASANPQRGQGRRRVMSAAAAVVLLAAGSAAAVEVFDVGEGSTAADDVAVEAPIAGGATAEPIVEPFAEAAAVVTPPPAPPAADPTPLAPAPPPDPPADRPGGGDGPRDGDGPGPRRGPGRGPRGRA